MRSLLGYVVTALGCVALGGCASGGVVSVSRSASSSGGTIESLDHRLSAVLLAEALAPSAEGHVRVAEQYVRLRILDAAHERVQRALERDPRFAPAHEMMARLWRDWGQAAMALPHASRAVYYEPESSSAHNTMGTVLDALGRPEAARAAYLRALELGRDAPWISSNLCYLEFREGRFDEARRHCEAAIGAAPDMAEAHNNLGLAYAAAGDLEGAEDAFLGGGDTASAHYNLGIVHLASGRHLDAAIAFEAAIAARPDFTAAKRRAHQVRLQILTATQRK